MKRASIGDFQQFCIARNDITERRSKGLPKPWTTDPVLRKYKFTNIFREFDKGTIALRRMTAGKPQDGLLVWNTCWYRIFNWIEHASNPGWCDTRQQLQDTLFLKRRRGDQIFTNAHMSYGWRPDKLAGTLSVCDSIYEHKDAIAEMCLREQTQESVFSFLMGFRGIGKFLAYEITTDFGHSMGTIRDRMTWGSVGPGARRGLIRLGMAPNLASMVRLLNEHAPLSGMEVRDIEHSLCEFDKYWRTVNGEGKPRMRYDG